MRKIPLTQDKFALVDDEDFEKVNQYKWYAKRKDHIFYAARHITISYKNYQMLFLHNFISPPPKGKFIDHIDGDGLNNQKNNLRVAMPIENSRNRKIDKDNISGYKGVYHRKDTGKFRAYIAINRKQYALGNFDTAIEAAKAYNQKASEVWGEFAKLNIIDKP